MRFNQQAAIKVVHAHLSDQEVEHFRHEAETIATLAHPSIVRVFDFDVQEGVPFVVMEYAPNGSLRRRFPRGSLVPLPQIISLVKQVADALQYAHEQKFIHRDVKPENMLLGRREEVLLSDFGLAAWAHSTASLSTQGIVGTIAYMAPEQIQGHPRAASDQYALGVVVYEWFCGVPPFVGDTVQLMYQHIHVPPPSLHERVAMISPEVEQVVFMALAKEPKQRFVRVAAFATALEQATQSALSSVIVPPPSGPLEQSGPLLPPSQSPMFSQVDRTLAQSQLLSQSGSITPPNPQSLPVSTSNLPLQVPPTKEVISSPSKEAGPPVTVTSPSQPFQQASIPVVQPRPEQARGGISRRTMIVGLTTSEWLLIIAVVSALIAGGYAYAIGEPNIFTGILAIVSLVWLVLAQFAFRQRR